MARQAPEPCDAHRGRWRQQDPSKDHHRLYPTAGPHVEYALRDHADHEGSNRDQKRAPFRQGYRGGNQGLAKTSASRSNFTGACANGHEAAREVASSN